VMSEQVERKLLGILRNPTESPYGNPIPGLDELDARPVPTRQPGVVSVVDLLAERGEDSVEARIRRLAEPLQIDPVLLGQLAAAGIRPNTRARFSVRDEYIRIEVEDRAHAVLELSSELAAHIFVLP
ncbi:MAG: dihydrofolate reductase, partial [Leucobacter sp.]|nr:dihydrofolate reductase [Leucobacter sp.]